MAGENGAIIGHNGESAERLRGLIERIERLDGEIKERRTDIKDIYREAKSAGFDTKVMAMLVRERKRDEDEVSEEEALLEIYRLAMADGSKRVPISKPDTEVPETLRRAAAN